MFDIAKKIGYFPYLKNEADLKNEDNLKYEADLKNKDNLKKTKPSIQIY